MLNPHEILSIEEQEIRANSKCTITIDFRDYPNDSIIDSKEFIVLPGIIDIYFPDLDDYCSIILIYNVKLYKTNDIDDSDDNIIVINYNTGDLIISQDYYNTGMDMGLLIKLLNGRIKYIKDPKILLTMINNIIPNPDLVHLEVLISNMLRDPTDYTILSRYSNAKQPEIIGVTSQAKMDSALSSIAYRNIDQAIEHAIVKNKEFKNNPIELILQEKFEEL
jgi:hypothetical protein